MYLKYYLDEEGKRVYTLKKTSSDGRNTLSAHPARFSEADKNSKYRLLIKKQILKMLLWEWRRLLRQRFRSTPKTPVTYKAVLKKKIMLSFVVFSISWHFLGDFITDNLFFHKDEETDEVIFTPPRVVKEERERRLREHHEKNAPISQHNFVYDA
ncbi:unnamed protein product [Bursaphelenchus xylophilus]|uniref:Nucleolar protein 10 n=1 Tax=Bursaphelenchus xylophilus TaxID=6326 RepID=A0A7I8XBH6_BURXY|nr:unnamed protein product [Bursaphelenchus xylophilus]CAG9084143.1 unnamed protein product [Bursaphelenchus xylophilus]